MYLPRKIDNELAAWRKEKEGMPMLLRGARQVGKSTAIRELAKLSVQLKRFYCLI
jgi:uncharacterized protein